MKLPPLKEWLAQSKKFWDMATPNNRKMMFPNVNGWDEFKSLMTNNWNNLNKNPGVFEEETIRTHNAFQMQMSIVKDSKKNTDKAMKMVEEAEEGESK